MCYKYLLKSDFMYLTKLKIRNFRSIKDITLNFSKGINILIGENNAGKTTIIDVLRICLGYRDQDGLRINKNDFQISNHNKQIKPIEFDLSFEKDIDEEIGHFIELYDCENDSLDLHFRFSLKQYEKYKKIHSDVWGGKNEGVNIPSEVFHSFIQVYLGALRDAERYLRPGRYNQLGDLIIGLDEKNISKDYNREKMVDELNYKIANSEFSRFIEDVKTEYLAKHLNRMTFEGDSILNITPINQDYEEISKNLKIRLPLTNNEKNNNYLELYQNGLGHNNLIYIAILLMKLEDLSKSDESSYLSLLIEEPEAHLQPQLQNLFFSYLNELNKELNTKKSFQIFITSHSPTITAKANLDSLIILQKDLNNENVVNANCKSMPFNDENKEYLQKFLDVTKSQLLFSKRIIFVEGISEALLIPIFAKKLGYELENKGVEVVMLNGLNFKHFVPLFDENNGLVFKGAIITDKDRKKLDNDESDTFKLLENSENNNLKVFGAEVTLEYDLLTSNPNRSFVREVFKQIHPKIFENVFKSSDEEIFKIMKNKNRNIKKSRIAWILSTELNNDPTIKYDVPEYIDAALNFVCRE